MRRERPGAWGTRLVGPGIGAVLILGLAGCIPPADLIAIQADLDAVRETQARLVSRLRSLEVVAAAGPAPATGPAHPRPDNDAIRTLEERLDALVSLVARLNRLTEDGAVRLHELTGRAASLEAIIRAQREFSPGGERPETRKTVAPDRLYSQAYRDYVRGQYDLALQGFRRYLEESPDGRLVANAEYWIGESLEAKHDEPSALAVFERLLTRHPTSEVAASALLKAGRLARRLGKADRGRAYLERVVKQFPASPEAALARQALEAPR